MPSIPITNQPEKDNAPITWVIKKRKGKPGVGPWTLVSRGARRRRESPRTVEVKSFGGPTGASSSRWSRDNFDEARSNPDFFVYIVENVGRGDPGLSTLKVLDHNRLPPLLKKAKERRHYEIPWPIADYDASVDNP